MLAERLGRTSALSRNLLPIFRHIDFTKGEDRHNCRARDEDDGTITAQSAFRSIRSSGETDADDGGAIKTILPRGSAAKEPLALSSLPLREDSVAEYAHGGG